jgi:hypothetical protein
MGFDIGTKFENNDGDESVVLHYNEEDDNYGVVFTDNRYREKWFFGYEILRALEESRITITVPATNSNCCNNSKHLSHKELYPHTCEYCGHDSYNGGMNNVDCSNSNCITKRNR